MRRRLKSHFPLFIQTIKKNERSPSKKKTKPLFICLSCIQKRMINIIIFIADASKIHKDRLDHFFSASACFLLPFFNRIFINIHEIFFIKCPGCQIRMDLNDILTIACSLIWWHAQIGKKNEEKNSVRCHTQLRINVSFLLSLHFHASIGPCWNVLSPKSILLFV